MVKYVSSLILISSSFRRRREDLFYLTTYNDKNKIEVRLPCQKQANKQTSKKKEKEKHKNIYEPKGESCEKEKKDSAQVGNLLTYQNMVQISFLLL
jgi:hypothetical protein